MNLGFVSAAVNLGYQTIRIRPLRGFYQITLPDNSTLPDIVAQATVEERHHDRLEITNHPVEQGASISDHAYVLPSDVILKLAWSNSPSISLNSLASAIESGSNISGSSLEGVFNIYRDLLDMYQARCIFTLWTGKRRYENMICKMLSTETDEKTANSLIITMECEQIIFVNTKTVTLSPETQKFAQETSSPVQQGTQTVSSPITSGNTQLH